MVGMEIVQLVVGNAGFVFNPVCFDSDLDFHRVILARCLL